MCSYITQKAEIAGSGKGPEGWFELSHATVYFDHPYFTPLEHTLNIDFINEEAGASSRVAVELSHESAWRLVGSLLSVLNAASGQIRVSTGKDADGLARETPQIA